MWRTFAGVHFRPDPRGRECLAEQLFRRNPVDLFLNRSPIDEAATFQNCLTICDHVRVSAQVRRRIGGVEFPAIGIFPQHIVGAPDFARPVSVIPWPAHGGFILEPGKFRVEADLLLFVAELPGTAGAVEQVQLVAAVEAAFFPILRKRADETYKRGYSGHGGDQ